VARFFALALVIGALSVVNAALANAPTLATSKRCFTQHNAAIRVPQAMPLPAGFRTRGSYLFDFKDEHTIRGVHYTNHGIVVFEATAVARARAERALIDAEWAGYGLDGRKVTPAQARMEGHGVAFLQWQGVHRPQAGAPDARAVTACLGPTS